MSDPAADDEEGGGPIRLPSRLEIRTVADVNAAIDRRDGKIVLDASSVTLVTSPGAQLLLAAVRDGRDVDVTDASPAFSDCLTMLGMDPKTLEPKGAAS